MCLLGKAQIPVPRPGSWPPRDISNTSSCSVQDPCAGRVLGGHSMRLMWISISDFGFTPNLVSVLSNWTKH